MIVQLGELACKEADVLFMGLLLICYVSCLNMEPTSHVHGRAHPQECQVVRCSTHIASLWGGAMNNSVLKELQDALELLSSAKSCIDGSAAQLRCVNADLSTTFKRLRR